MIKRNIAREFVSSLLNMEDGQEVDQVKLVSAINDSDLDGETKKEAIKLLYSSIRPLIMKQNHKQVEVINFPAPQEPIEEVRVNNLEELSVKLEQLKEAINNIKIEKPNITVASPEVNVPAPIINIPEFEIDEIVDELKSSLDKIRNNNKSNPLAVRLTDGADWVKELKKQSSQLTQYLSDVSYVKNSTGQTINPSTDETLLSILSAIQNQASTGTSIPSGAGTNGTKDLTSADTWYAVPSTVPTSDYVLVVAIESNSGTVRWGYANTGTPSATNGLQAPSMLTLRLAANQSIYYASSTAGDDVNWTTKVI